MKILLTGATGFIGQEVLKQLLGAGHTVKCLIRNPTRANLVASKQLEIIQGDLCKSDRLRFLVRDCEAVCHLAGSVYSHKINELFRINRDYTSRLYEATFSTQVQRFLYLSSIAAVGPQWSPDAAITETITPRPCSVYGKSKLGAETALSDLQAKHGGPAIIIIRAPMVYGPNQNPNSRFYLLINKLRKGTFAYIGNADNQISLCDIWSLASFTAHLLLTQPLSQNVTILNAAHDQSISFRHMVNLICKQKHIEPPRQAIPHPAAYFIAFVLTLCNHFLNKKDMITIERVKEITGNWKVSNKKAKLLGFQEKMNLEQGLIDHLSTL